MCLAMTLKSARLTTFPIWCNLLSRLVKMHTTGAACIVCRGDNEALSVTRLPERKLVAGPPGPSCQPFPRRGQGPSAQAPGAQPSVTVEREDDGAVPCTQASALFSLGSSLLAKSQLKRNKGYEPPSSWVLSEAGVGLAFSRGSSETACLLVPVLREEVTNRSQAEEALRISPDTKQNKNRRVCLVCEANMYPVWCLGPSLSFIGGEDQIRESQAPRGVFTVLSGSW